MGEETLYQHIGNCTSACKNIACASINAMASESADTRAYMDSVSKNIDALEAKVHDMDLKLATILEFMENSAQKLAEDAPRDAAPRRQTLAMCMTGQRRRRPPRRLMCRMRRSLPQVPPRGGGMDANWQPVAPVSLMTALPQTHAAGQAQNQKPPTQPGQPDWMSMMMFHMMQQMQQQQQHLNSPGHPPPKP